MKPFPKVTAAALFLAVALLYVPSVIAKEAEKIKSQDEGPPPATGEITALDSESLTIKDHAGDTHVFVVHKDTKYGVAAEPQKFDDFQKGDHVMVAYTRDGEDAVAHVIRELPAHGHDGYSDVPAADILKSNHEGPPPAAGEVIEIGNDVIAINDHQGMEHRILVRPETKCGTGNDPQQCAAILKHGVHVLVTYEKEGDAMVAQVIREVPGHGYGHVEDMKRNDE